LFKFYIEQNDTVQIEYIIEQYPQLFTDIYPIINKLFESNNLKILEILLKKFSYQQLLPFQKHKNIRNNIIQSNNVQLAQLLFDHYPQFFNTEFIIEVLQNNDDFITNPKAITDWSLTKLPNELFIKEITIDYSSTDPISMIWDRLKYHPDSGISRWGNPKPNNIKQLLNKYPKFFTIITSYNNNFLHKLATDYNDVDWYDIFKLLIKQIDLEHFFVKNSSGQTPFDILISQDVSTEIMEQLYEFVIVK
ncbi:unnamed protein product, partial [marine sediment metagenome]